ncbi:MAG: DUF5916 domain-containing protein [Gemmatimonadota bacterium]
MILRDCSILAATAFTLSVSASPQATASVHDRPLTTSRAVRVSDPPRIDGRLDDAVWAQAPITDSFTQIEPDEGKPSSQRTEVRVLYDDVALYVGVHLHDNGSITGRLGRRDMALGDSDWFGLAIDSYHDHRTAFVFDVNPLGVRRDAIKTIQSDDNSWDPVWDVATEIIPGGWTAEYRVPFSQLRFSGATEQVWGIQFERLIGREAEYSVSTFSPRSEQGGVPRYGHLEGLASLRTGKRLEILPYVLQRAEYVRPGSNPFRTDTEMFSAGGVDLLVRATSNLTVNATINPDFGQVEVDPAVVNLGVYETFFEEKRPFFIEGGEIFDFGANSTSGGQIFYSRRIGRTPSLFPPAPESDRPNSTTILGAAKLSGKVGGWSLGLLEAVTDEENARYLTPAAGVVQEAVVEPRANYLVGRARRELRGGRSLIGAAFTAVNRDLADDASRNQLHSSAYAGGLDFRHEFGNRTWVARGSAVLSRVAGTPAAMIRTQRLSNHFFQRPDARHLEVDSTATSLDGYSVNAAFARQQGLHWRGEVAAAVTAPGFEVNDLGFATRTDRRDFAANVTYVENAPGRFLRRWQANSFLRIERNFDWQAILNAAGLTGFFQTSGLWTMRFNAVRFIESFDDRLTRGGPLAARPGWWESFARVATDPRRDLTIALGVNGIRQDEGAWTANGELQFGLKPGDRWNLTMGPSLFRGYTPAQFVTSVADPAATATDGRRYIFAPLDQTELAFETRFNFTFSPRLSLETYAQPLLSRGDFGRARVLVAPRTYDFDAWTEPIPDLDFNLRSLRGNAVLRWEWRAGSTIYLAWQQSRRDEAAVGDFDFGRDRRALFRAHPDNIFLVKVSYWLNP